MRQTLKQITSLFLCCALLTSVSCFSFATERDLESIINVSINSEQNTLTVKTTEDTYRLIVVEEGSNYIIREYKSGLLVDEIISSTASPSTKASPFRVPSGRGYFATAKYTGDLYGLDPLYHMNVKIYRSITNNGTASYTPKNGILTLAQFVNDLMSILSIPAGVVNTVAGAAIAGATFVAGKWLSWQTPPTLSCNKSTYYTTLVHYGDAPIYYEGEERNFTGTRYVVSDSNHSSSNGDKYYEGLVVDAKDSRSAESVYKAMYNYSAWSFIGWA